jgi:hypothetical protein
VLPASASEPLYGITLKLLKILVEHPPKKDNLNFIKDEHAFIDDEDDV